MTEAMIIMTLIICTTINSIHNRNKRAEVVKEAIRNGHDVNANF